MIPAAKPNKVRLFPLKLINRRLVLGGKNTKKPQAKPLPKYTLLLLF